MSRAWGGTGGGGSQQPIQWGAAYGGKETEKSSGPGLRRKGPRVLDPPFVSCTIWASHRVFLSLKFLK